MVHIFWWLRALDFPARHLAPSPATIAPRQPRNVCEPFSSALPELAEPTTSSTLDWATKWA